MGDDVTGTLAARVSIDGRTAIGAVSLTVADLARARAFYEQVLGLVAREHGHDDTVLALTDAGGRADLVVLHEDRAAPAFDPHGNGLFHLALLVVDRLELARSLQRVADAGWQLTGASDHLVSEALYLRDPDGNGIEIYRDRPRAQWPADERGGVQMATLALDLPDLLDELARAPGHGRPQALAPGARIGHVHLQVSELAGAERFYCDVLGFDVTVRGYPGALFVSAGGYHHHIGLNTWNSRGAAPVASGGIGLRAFDVRLPDRLALERVLDRVREAGIATEPVEGAGDATAILVRDPFGIAIVLHSA